MTTLLRRSLLAGVALSALSLAPHAQAQTTLSYYDFGTTTTGAAPTTFTATSGSGTLTVNGFTASTTAANNVAFFGGTLLNAQGASPAAGAALALLGGTATGGNNGGNITFTANTTGFNGINVSFATQRTSTGFNSNQFQYSINGGTTFTTLQTYVPYTATSSPTTGFTTTPAPTGTFFSFDLSNVVGISSNPLTQFRIVFGGASGTSGNNRIDNLVVSGTSVVPPVDAPEPSSIVALAVGAGVLGLLVARRRTANHAA